MVELCLLLQPHFPKHGPTGKPPKSPTRTAAHYFLNTPWLLIFHLLPPAWAIPPLVIGFLNNTSTETFGFLAYPRPCARLSFLLCASTEVCMYFSFFIQPASVQCFLSARHCSKHFYLYTQLYEEVHLKSSELPQQ